MVTLVCAVVGEAGKAFGVKIEDGQQLWELAKAVKAEKPNKIMCDPNELQLFLAKTEDGELLKSKDPLVRRMRKGGLFRWTPDKRLECAFILLVVLMRKLPKKDYEVDNFEEHITRSMLLWQRFEHFVAFYRSVKSIAFCEVPVALSEFHAGARFGAIDGIRIKEPSPRTVVEAINQHDTTSVSEVSTCFTNRDGDIKLSDMNTIVINGASAPAGDLFMRVQLVVGHEQVQCNEVIQCKLLQTKRKMSKVTYDKQQAKGMEGKSDVFMLIT